jgi:hypothetical protein
VTLRSSAWAKATTVSRVGLGEGLLKSRRIDSGRTPIRWASSAFVIPSASRAESRFRTTSSTASIRARASAYEEAKAGSAIRLSKYRSNAVFLALLISCPPSPRLGVGTVTLKLRGPRPSPLRLRSTKIFTAGPFAGTLVMLMSVARLTGNGNTRGVTLRALRLIGTCRRNWRKPRMGREGQVR